VYERPLSSAARKIIVSFRTAPAGSAVTPVTELAICAAGRRAAVAKLERDLRERQISQRVYDGRMKELQLRKAKRI
jgi:hypothetical protein